MKSIVPTEVIENKILLIRGQKVMLSIDLAKLYGVEHRVLMQAVKRNINRFPKDFMFQLSPREFANSKSQIVTSSWGGIRKPPHAFTEHGALMAASVLNSKRAVEARVFIIRAFVRLRELIISEKRSWCLVLLRGLNGQPDFRDSKLRSALVGG